MIKGLFSTKKAKPADVQRGRDGMEFSAKMMPSVKMAKNGTCFSLLVNVRLEHFGMEPFVRGKFPAKTDKFLTEKMVVFVLKIHIGITNGVSSITVLEDKFGMEQVVNVMRENISMVLFVYYVSTGRNGTKQTKNVNVP